MTQERIHKQRPASQERTEAPAESPKASESKHKKHEELDALLDEIDEVLESNAEEFVKSYIQKGGQ